MSGVINTLLKLIGVLLLLVMLHLESIQKILTGKMSIEQLREEELLKHRDINQS